MTDDTRNANRRNGKRPSCEPCRKNKTKCDHTFPKCDRCHKRGIADQCFYHPAPLTKRHREPEGDGGEVDPSTDSRPKKRIRTPKPRASGRPQVDVSLLKSSLPHDAKFADAVASQTYRPGYLGPLSYAAILPRDDDTQLPRDREASVQSDDSDHELAHQHPLTKAMRVQMVTDVLKGFRNYRLIRDLTVLYYTHCEAGLVAGPIVINAVRALEKTVIKYDLANSTPNTELVSMILENSSKPLKISTSIEADQFHVLFTGDNLRLEFLAFLLSTACRSMQYGMLPEDWNEDVRRTYGPKFSDEMLRLSTTCLVLCTFISPVNDITIWMFWDNLQATFMICGYSGPPLWRRMGELATQIYALGIHREGKNTHVPFFLLETRRKLFCAFFNFDKTISTFLGRPFHISKRHINVKVPLDLTDEELTADTATLTAACQALDVDGWNQKRQYNRASWLRVRYQSSQFREEILDIALAKADDHVEQRLLDISRRCRETWESHPSHMRYWPECWEEVSSSACLMLVNVYLNYLYSEFMIQKLLDRQPLAMNSALLQVSMNMLSTALTLGQIRDRSYDTRRDFLHTLCLYGIPSGSALASAIQEAHQKSLTLPTCISRSEIIRMLSVLISHLDAASQAEGGAKIGDGNYALCRKAAKTFTRVIDAVLDHKPAASVEFGDLSLNLDFFAGPTLEAFDNMNFAGEELYDNVDWGSPGTWNL